MRTAMSGGVPPLSMPGRGVPTSVDGDDDDRLGQVARNGARLDQRVEWLDERLDVGRVRLVPGRIVGADDLLGRLADGGDVDEDRPRGRADPVDELLVVVVRGQRGAGRGVEDVLDE